MRNKTPAKLYIATAGLLCALAILTSWWERQILPYLIALLGADARQFLSRTLFYVGGQPVRIWFLIKTALYLAFLAIVSHLAGYLITRIMQNSAGFGAHRRYVLSRVVSFLIYGVGILIGVHLENIQTNTLVILGGTLGVGIGFGLQSLVSNLIAGFILFIEQPIHIGDVIEFGARTGEVTRIGTRCSWVKTADNALLVIPNSEFTTKAILNWTASDPRIRQTILVAVANGNDIAKVMHILLIVARQQADVLEDPGPEVILTELGQNAVTFSLRVWTGKGVNDFARLRSGIYLQIVQSFKEESVVLPVPQLDIHWAPGNAPLPSD